MNIEFKAGDSVKFKTVPKGSVFVEDVEEPEVFIKIEPLLLEADDDDDTPVNAVLLRNGSVQRFSDEIMVIAKHEAKLLVS